MKVPKAGVWCPAVTFFNPTTGDVDYDAQQKYFHYLSTTGLAGIIALGSNAESMLLTREERSGLVSLARKAVGPDYPVMAGVSGFSTKQVLQYCDDAHKAGADFGLLLPAAYFGKATTNSVINAFYDEVAQKSPIPIVIYNFPGVCNGVDLDSETIAAIAKRNPGKIVGVKLTCGSVAKITRLAAEMSPEEFATFGGQSDFLIGGLAVGSSGCVAAFSNVFPKTISKTYELYKAGKVQHALDLQRQAALAESPVKTGIASTKYAVSQFSAKAAGISDAEEKLKPRSPYEPPTDAVKANIKKIMEEMGTTEATI